MTRSGDIRQFDFFTPRSWMLWLASDPNLQPLTPALSRREREGVRGCLRCPTVRLLLTLTPPPSAPDFPGVLRMLAGRRATGVRRFAGLRRSEARFATDPARHRA